MKLYLTLNIKTEEVETVTIDKNKIYMEIGKNALSEEPKKLKLITVDIDTKELEKELETEPKQMTIPEDIEGQTLKQLGKKVKWCRKQLGWSQRELAKRTGTTQNIVSRLERGGNVYQKNKEKILEILNL